MITGFILAHICLGLIILGFIMPRWYDVFVPTHRRHEGTEATIAMKPRAQLESQAVVDVHSESGGTGYGNVLPGEKTANQANL